MPMYDRKCVKCGFVMLDQYEPINMIAIHADGKCFGVLERVLLPGKAPGVIGDEIDVTIANGLCNPDSSPRRFRSRQELSREAARAGLTNAVEHKGGKSGDRSRHTTRWI